MVKPISAFSKPIVGQIGNKYASESDHKGIYFVALLEIQVFL